MGVITRVQYPGAEGVHLRALWGGVVGGVGGGVGGCEWRMGGCAYVGVITRKTRQVGAALPT